MRPWVALVREYMLAAAYWGLCPLAPARYWRRLVLARADLELARRAR